MSCTNCNKVSHADFGDTFSCIYCKYPSSKAVPRATVNVQLEDATVILNASATGSPAEILLKYDAQSLMNSSKLGSDVNLEELMDSEEQIFHIKVAQLEPNTAEYKCDIVFVLDTSSTITDALEATNENEKNKNPPCLADNANSDSDIISPLAKRSLFETSTKPMVSNINAVAKHPGKGKLVSSIDPMPKHSDKGKLE